MDTVAPRQPLLRIPEVGDRLSLSERTVRRLILRGEIPAVRPAGGNGPIRVDPDELEAWLDGRRITV